MGKNYSDLEQAVKTMLEDENKRRTTAIEWINSLQDIMLEVAKDLWGNMNDVDYNRNTVKIKACKADGTIITYYNFYFRYEAFNDENIGFYSLGNEVDTIINYDGVNILDMTGASFWVGVKTLTEWVYYLEQELKSRNASRNEIVNGMKEGMAK